MYHLLEYCVYFFILQISLQLHFCQSISSAYFCKMLNILFTYALFIFWSEVIALKINNSSKCDKMGLKMDIRLFLGRL